ncbi:MAG: GerMN domain-containing protein [Acidimicrobiia bacterium]
MKAGKAMRRAAIVTAVVVCSAGCGVSEQSRPDPIDRADVPFQLLASTTSPSPTTTLNGPVAFPVALVDGDGLVLVERAVDPPLVPRVALESLLEGPTASETAEGLSTAIPAGAGIGAVRQKGGLLTIELGRTVRGAGPDEIQAIGQLVLTATAVAGVERVRFRVGGEPVQVPIGDGTISSGPVRRTDYERLLRSQSA